MFFKLKTMSLLTLFLAIGLFSACGDETPDPMTSTTDIIYTNGKIYTVNPDQEWADAMYVKNGVIQAIGTTADVEAAAPKNAQTIDLEGSFVMPGIHDVHMHPLEATSDNFQFIVTEGSTDPEDYALDVEAAMADNPGDDWLLGWGYDLEVLFEATRTPKLILDDVAPNRPVAIMELTSHSIWVNSKALELMGVDNNSENPAGGIYMREEDGEVNGILVDNAGNLLIDLAIPTNETSRQNDYNGLVNTALPELAKHGITSVCDARTYWKRDHHVTWKRVADEDKLTTRVNLGLWAYPTENDATQLQTLKDIYEFDENSLLKINQIKLYSDGIIHNTTCAMHDDYLLDYFGEMTNNGLNYFTESRIAEYIAELEATGFDFHIHAIGNRGIHEVLNAVEQSGTAAGRHRITHTEYVDAADFPRFATLNVTADAQVAGEFTQPENWTEFDFLIGNVADNVVPLKDLNEHNARITLSSDWDVSTLNPFVGLQNAVTRAPQNLSIADAIEAYTINAAYVMRQEDKVGTLEVGKEADFIVLNRNLLEMDAADISGTEVLETYLRGERVYEK